MNKPVIWKRRTHLALLLSCFLALPLAACGGGDADLDVAVEDVDQDSPMYPTEQEEASFRPAADSTLTEAQVEAYLRTSLLQFDMVRDENKRIRETVQKMGERQEKGGALSQFRNIVDAGRTLASTADLVGGSYVRAARSLGYNPAEMQWVQERMAELSGYLMLKPMQEQAVAAATEMRAQAQALSEADLGGAAAMFDVEEQRKELLRAADEIEAQNSEEMKGATVRNERVLKSARPAVTDEMWTAIGFAGGTSGLVALAGWSDADPEEIDSKLDEFRTVYQAALENRAVQTSF